MSYGVASELKNLFEVITAPRRAAAGRMAKTENEQGATGRLL